MERYIIRTCGTDTIWIQLWRHYLFQ